MPVAPRREWLVFAGACAFAWTYLAVLAALTPTILDDWYQVAYIKHHGLTLGSIWDNAVYNYNHYNPRVGENFLLIVNGPRIINVLLTPTIELVLLFSGFALALGRWPRPTVRDAQLLAIELALIWLAAPVPGVLFAYRPFCTNYLYAMAFTLLLLVPYRFALAGWSARRDRWLIPAMFAAGWATGMGNEHIGLAVGVAIAAIIGVYVHRHRAIRAWMVSGLAGLAIGYPMLLFAPGQLERYGSLGARQGPIATALERGVDGLAEIVLDFLWEAQLGVLVILVGVFVALLGAHRRGDKAPAPDRPQVVTMLALVLGAFAMVGTLFGSPTTGERLFFAPAVMFMLAGFVLVDVLAVDRAARRAMLGVATVAIAIFMVWGIIVYVDTYRECADREDVLESATPGSRIEIPPLSRMTRNPWFLGEDFDYASLREFIAHQVYGLRAIELDRPVFAEPPVPYHTRLAFTLEPAMPDAEVWNHVVMPLTYVSAYPDRVIQLIRRLVPQLRRIPGHRLRQVDGWVEGYDLPEHRGRPIIGSRWRDGESMVVDYIIRADDDLRLYFLLLNGTFPEDLTDAYIHACGKTVSPKLERERRGIRLAYVPWCRGLVVTTACTPTECWLVGNYWH